MRKRFIYLWCILYLVVGGVLQLQGAECSYLIKQAEVLIDNKGEFSADNIRHGEFKPSDDLNFGYTGAAVWLRFPLNEVCPGENNYLVAGFRTIDYFDYYLLRNGSFVDSQITGYLRPVISRSIPISRITTQLPTEALAGDSVYLRIQKMEGTLRVELNVTGERTLLRQDQSEWTTIFFFLGASFIMLMFALSYFVAFRQKIFLWYMLFVAGLSFHQLSNYGYGSLYLWGDWYWLSNISRVMWNVPIELALLEFSFVLLRVEDFCPPIVSRLYRWSRWVLGVQMLIVFLPIPTHPWRVWAFGFHVIFTGFLLTLFVYASWRAVRKKHVPGYLFLAGESVVLLMALIMAMRNFTIINMEVLPDHIHLFMGTLAMSTALFSMVAYSRSMYTKVIRQTITIHAPRPEPRKLNEEELKRLNEVYLQTEQYFEKERPWLNAQLSLNSLAEEAGLPEHLLSRAINLKADKHFFDYVNTYRIKEATRLLRDEKTLKQFTMEALAAQCGFSNKTSFNKAFKKFTGETPTSYRKKLLGTSERV